MVDKTQSVDEEIQRVRQEMLRYAAKHSPYYRQQDWAEACRNGKHIDLQNVPVTSKAVVRREPKSFHVTDVPDTHGFIVDKYTSGTTGEPLHARKTAKHFAINAQENRRLKSKWEFARHKNVLHLKNAHGDDREGRLELKTNRSGNLHRTLYTLNSKPAAKIMLQNSIQLLSGYPSSVLGAMLEEDTFPELRLIATIGEVVPDDLIDLLKLNPLVRHYDCYGLIETGIAAGRCALCANYHPADRHLLFEIIDEKDEPVSPGQTGRVVLSTYFNAAMPLIRYETGDLAVASDQSSCAFSNQSIARIQGANVTCSH
jgi:phenylacetate-CoA ligase